MSDIDRAALRRQMEAVPRAAEIIAESQTLLARDVLDLLAALDTAERERDQALAALARADAGTTRIEWGHRLDPESPDWAAFHPDDRAEVIRCRHDGQCARPKIGGWPAVHVWRAVPAGDIPWQTGTPPEASNAD